MEVEHFGLGLEVLPLHHPHGHLLRAEGRHVEVQLGPAGDEDADGAGGLLAVEDGHLRGAAKTVFQQRFGNIPYTGTFWGPAIPTTSFGAF